MEKQISLLSFWLGLISVVLAVLLRGLGALGIWAPHLPGGNNPISYDSFYRAGVLFLLLGIAASLRAPRV